MSVLLLTLLECMQRIVTARSQIFTLRKGESFRKMYTAIRVTVFRKIKIAVASLELRTS